MLVPEFNIVPIWFQVGIFLTLKFPIKLSLKIGVELPSSVISTLNLGKAALGKRSILQIHAEKK